MEPLSVAASIIGILAAAGKVAEIVQPLVSSSAVASQLARQVYNEVSSIRTVLTSLKAVLQDLATPLGRANARACYVQIDSLVVLFTDGTLLFSELEALLQPFKLPATGTVQLLFRERALWVKRKNEIVNSISRMQRFLTALSALLNIFQW